MMKKAPALFAQPGTVPDPWTRGAEMHHDIPLRQLELFFAKVGPPDENGCWRWQGANDGNVNGYSRWARKAADGRIQHYSGHRLMFSIFGPEPLRDGMVLDHLCRNKWCVNPEHLEQVTQSVNTLRGLVGVPRTVCKKGHDLTPDNTYVAPSGCRQCRICKRTTKREWRKARRAAGSFPG